MESYLTKLWRVSLPLLLAWCGCATASIVHIDFRYGLSDDQTAEGYADFDANRLLNPSPDLMRVPVQNLFMAIRGTGVSDGVYDEQDLPWLYWDTGGGTLDFTRELVGQETVHCPGPSGWGYRCGDFSFDGVNARGVFAYSHLGLRVPGAVEGYLELTSAVPNVIVEPDSMALSGLAILALFAGAGSRRTGWIGQ